MILLTYSKPWIGEGTRSKCLKQRWREKYNAKNTEVKRTAREERPLRKVGTIQGAVRHYQVNNRRMAETRSRC